MSNKRKMELARCVLPTNVFKRFHASGEIFKDENSPVTQAKTCRTLNYHLLRE